MLNPSSLPKLPLLTGTLHMVFYAANQFEEDRNILILYVYTRNQCFLSLNCSTIKIHHSKSGRDCSVEWVLVLAIV